MISDPEGTVLALFIAFCRIGGCMMALPGFSSARLPMQIRFFVAFTVSLAVLPVLWDSIYPRVTGGDPTVYMKLVFGELMIGVMYGLIARLYTLGLQFTGSILAMSIGFSAPGGADIVEDSAENPLTNTITFAGLMVLFVLDFHHIVFKALIDSYTAMPLGGFPDPQRLLITMTDTLSEVFMIMLRLASPFLVFGLMFNVAVGLVNKLAPQIPLYFVSTPYLLIGGIFLLYLSIAALLRQFADGFAAIFMG
ncbi:flagellar type III secretion system protein FliR [Ciceribacter sp. L1K23]|uniref:flagellar biosynthetic protein FliR n=1 Tax=unclassified Ciceribacter TaxID=2628820 RepID=UPI001ABE9486|nr:MULTISPECIES: flagellar biosynthetic protein FliR [unclassified Ciceribacter]MBO3758344.1 flagellar type III secretion system protein FliR [Ciceribacter sp. L1K22]MBR0556980.1 flagellar type III secretion system protein FliR [Ciceribacter sp. L1K23]